MNEPKNPLGVIFKSLLVSDKMKSEKILSQREIAERLGIDESFLSKFLAGKRNFKDEMLIKLIGLMPSSFQIEYLKQISIQYKLDIDKAQSISEEGGREGTLAKIAKLLRQSADNLELLIEPEDSERAEGTAIRILDIPRFWMRWIGQNVRFQEDSASRYYTPIKIADIEINLVLEIEELKREKYRIIPFLISFKDNIIEEEITLSVSVEGETSSVSKESQVLILQGDSIDNIEKGERFEITITYKDKTYKQKFKY